MKIVIAFTVLLIAFTEPLYSLTFDNTLEPYEFNNEPKSVGTALCWSLGATMIPPVAVMLVHEGGVFTGIMLGSIIIGPSAGHFYAGQWRRGRTSTAIRTGICAVGVGLMWKVASGYSILEEGFSQASGVAAITFCGVLGCALFDIVTLPNSVDIYNKSIGKTGKLHFIPNLDMQTRKYGISFVYKF